VSNDWRVFFDGHADRYDDEVFTRGTADEVAFLRERLGPPPRTVLDLGCGTGRHAVGLARAGYRVTGLDLSPGMLARARARAEAAGVEVEWVEGDARAFARPGAFDAAVCLCEGAMGLFDERAERREDRALLAGLFASLRPGGLLIGTFDVLLSWTEGVPSYLVERSEASPEAADFTTLSDGVVEEALTDAGVAGDGRLLFYRVF